MCALNAYGVRNKFTHARQFAPHLSVNELCLYIFALHILTRGHGLKLIEIQSWFQKCCAKSVAESAVIFFSLSQAKNDSPLLSSPLAGKGIAFSNGNRQTTK